MLQVWPAALAGRDAQSSPTPPAPPAADRVVGESLAVLASVAQQRDHFAAVMAALLGCFRGSGGARLLQVRCPAAGIPSTGEPCAGAAAAPRSTAWLVRRVTHAWALPRPKASRLCFVLNASSVPLASRMLPCLQRRGGLVIQQMSQRLGGLRVYRELSRLLQVGW